MMSMNKDCNPIKKRTMIRIQAELASPMLISSGNNEYSDADVLLDYHHQPYLPGSSIAGVLRHYMSNAYDVNKGKEEDKVADMMFGDPLASPEDKLKLRRISSIYVYDASIQNAQISVRDGIRLDEKKTTIDTAKYMVEVVEQGATLQIDLEYVERSNDISHMDCILAACKAIAEGELCFGAKHNRGFGKLKVNGVYCKEFDMRKQEDVKQWLSCNQRKKEDGWESINLDDMPYSSLYHCLKVPLRLDGTLMIRKEVDPLDNEETSVHATQLMYEDSDNNKYAIIPGTTWMGAIRSRLASTMVQYFGETTWLAAQSKLDPLFGTFSPSTSAIKLESSKIKEEELPIKSSKIKVEESLVKGGNLLTMTRNRIDRFTGGTVNGALFSEEVWVGGTTELVVRWPKGFKDEINSEDAILGCFAWIIFDLQNGLLAIGGETSVGRGVFSAGGDVKFDGKNLDFSTIDFNASKKYLQRLQEGTL